MGKKQAAKRAAKMSAKQTKKSTPKQPKQPKQPKRAGGLKTKLQYDVRSPWEIQKAVPETASKEQKKALRDEYTRLRDIAQKRVKRMEKDPYGKYTSEYKAHAQGFKKLRDIKDDKELRAAMSEVANFLSSPYGTVSGAKILYGKVYESVHSEYKWITKDNFQDFIEFMEYAKSVMKGREFDSTYVLDMFKNLSKQGASKEKMFEAIDAYAKGRQ